MLPAPSLIALRLAPPHSSENIAQVQPDAGIATVEFYFHAVEQRIPPLF